MSSPAPGAQQAHLEPLQSFDNDADMLAWMWLDTQTDHAAVQRRAQRLVAQASARGEPRTAALSTAFEALRLAVFAALEPGTPARVDKLLQSVQGQACARAQQLGRAAGVHAQWVELQRAPPQERAQALQLLNEPVDADAPAAPPAERFWTEVALCALHTAQAARDDAWACGLRAQVLAQDVGHDLLQAVAALRLAQTFIDDHEATTATALLDQAVAAAQRCGPLPVALHHELLLALLWAGHMRQAASWLDAQPTLLNPALLQRLPSLAAAAALARTWQGRHEEAQRLLNATPPPGNGHTLPALQVWVVAAAHLQLGLPVLARSLIEQGLAWLQVPGLRPLAPQLARLYGLLGLACEAQRDTAGAQRAFAGAQGDGAHTLPVGRSGAGASAPSDPSAASRGPIDESAEHPAANPSVADGPTDGGGPDWRAGRSRFLTCIAHEMRNGVFGVQGPLSLLQVSALTPEQCRTLDLAQRSSQGLLALCNDVLDLARMDARRFALRPEPTDLAPLLADTLQTARLAAQARRLQLHWQVSDRLPSALWCDGQRVQQVLLNLTSNAIKFTREGSVTVDVQWRPALPGQAAGQLTVSVQDTGPGLTAPARALLFKDFAQLLQHDENAPGTPQAGDAAAAAADPGLGLGLAISQGLVQQMGGSMGVDSTPGQGSRFWFSLPMQLG